MIDSTIAPLTYFHLSVGHDKLSAALGGCTKNGTVQHGLWQWQGARRYQSRKETSLDLLAVVNINEGSDFRSGKWYVFIIQHNFKFLQKNKAFRDMNKLSCEP